MRCGRWATATSDRTTRDPGQPGVTAALLPGRAPGAQHTVARCCSALTCHGRAESRGVRSLCRRAG
ncbi:DUF6207 family protein [Streptomyces deserti]